MEVHILASYVGEHPLETVLNTGILIDTGKLLYLRRLHLSYTRQYKCLSLVKLVAKN